VVSVLHTAHLSPADLAAARALCDASFRGFTDEDWSHALGGQHAVVHADGRLVAHGAIVLRRLLVDGRWRRCGYVEAIVVDEAHRGRGHAGSVLAALESLAPGLRVARLVAVARSDVRAHARRCRGDARRGLDLRAGRRPRRRRADYL
jgi:aminoglycoside 2'-N-acetyltransferase I